MRKIAAKSPQNNTKKISVPNFIQSPLNLLMLLSALILIGMNFGERAASASVNSDAIDPNFNVQIATNSFGSKSVALLKTLPDNKILASGFFNNYNGQPVSSFVRLNSDGSLDTTFNNNLFDASSLPPNNILLLKDGKILIGGLNLILNGQTQPTKSLLRLNADGTIDTRFNYTLGSTVHRLAEDSSGRILIMGFFQVIEDGVPVSRFLIRLNADGSHDPSFRFESSRSLDRIAVQNDKIIVAGKDAVQHVIYRLNENGSTDSSFTLTGTGGFAHREILVQPDGKILALNDAKLLRLNENGGEDASFQSTNFPRQPRGISLHRDGRITVSYGNSSAEGVIFLRLLPNGAADPAFSVFTYRPYLFGAQDIHTDDSILIGDNNPGFVAPLSGNGFIRLLSNGTVDAGFNPGGTGFLNVFPGNVRAIAVQADGKILIGGKFDKVGETFRVKIARLNTDATVDGTFQITTGGSGNSFSQVNEIFNIRPQADGKLIVTGSFNYFAGGAQRNSIVRLNADGSINDSFIPSINLPDLFSPVNGGTNRFVFQPDGKIVVGSSRISTSGITTPLRLNVNGALDTTFTPTIYNSRNSVFILDTAIQPDGKILIGGRYQSPDINGGFSQSILARLNSDGSTDTTFQMSEAPNSEISAIRLLGNGKILIAGGSDVHSSSRQSKVQRLNSDGSLDASFESGSGANGKINALLVLPSGNILVGGKFSTYNDQPRRNLVKLNENGALDPTVYSLNEEVFCLTLDNENRILLGGSFTAIGVGGGQNVGRSHAARLIEATTQARRTRFDFDGDGRADLATFNLLSGNWSIRQSRTDQTLTVQFGADGDKTTAADYDGDGKTDIAVYRPSEGNWYLLRSTEGFAAFRWGLAEDKPVPADYDGDGRADIAVYRGGSWFILKSSDFRLAAVGFGLPDDIALTDVDFDGDGRADIAVWRPSNGFFYWLASGSQNQFHAVQFGQNGDIPVAADYNGDGKTDLAVFRPSGGLWKTYLTTPDGAYQFQAAQFGLESDEPIAADYDGDGRADIAVRRKNVWHILMSGQGYSGRVFGDENDQAVAIFPKR